MSTEEGTAVGPDRRPSAPSTSTDAARPTSRRSEGAGASLSLRRPSWTSRDHPVFVPLASFFAGMLLVIFTFGLLGAIVSQVLGYDAAGTVFPYFFVVFVVPLVLIGFAHTRRVGLYLLLGMVLTALVVIGVAALTLYVLLAGDG